MLGRTPGRTLCTAWLIVIAIVGGRVLVSNRLVPAGFANAAPAPPAAPTAPPGPGVAGAENLRVMLAELASAKACDQIRNNFQALPSAGRPSVMSGVLWIHTCRITNSGTKVTFHLEGHGWQWIDEEKKKSGGTFTVHQYVRFGLVATITGTLDVGYDPGSHVASIWFSVQGAPEVQFTPIGKLDVEAEGAWSSVLSATASLLAKSPEASAKKDAKTQGASDFRKQLAEGISVTVDMCTGMIRSGMGQTLPGQMGALGVGETERISVEVHPGGVMIFGPQLASEGMTVDVDVRKGTARLLLLCNAQAQAQANAFLAGRDPPRGSFLVARDVRGKATVRAGAARCPVSLVATAAPGSSEAVTLTWRRPALEAAQSTGGPMIYCSGKAPARTPSR